MKMLKELLSGHKRVPTLLLAAGVLLLLMALGFPKESEPAGWQPLDSRMVSGQVEPDSVNELPNVQINATDLTATQAAQPEPEPMASTPVPEEPAPVQPVVAEPDAGGKIDINRASAELLDTLPGIGAAKAQAIITDREQNGFFRSAEDITRVRGIGPKMLEKMKERIVALP